LINANIPKDRLFIIFVSAFVLILQCKGNDYKARLEIEFLTFLLLMLGAFWLVLMKLKYGQQEGLSGFQISSRYFLSLTPAGIIGTVLFSWYWVRVLPSKAWKALSIMILAGLLLFRFHKMVEQTPLINKCLTRWGIYL